MRVRCHAQGKFYTIECPEGTRIVRRSDHPEEESSFHDHLIVRLNGKEICIPADPPELLPMLAESRNFGVLLVGEPEPDVRPAGAACPGCGQDDVNWLQLRAVSEAIHCDRCGREFAVTVATIPSVTPLRQWSR